MSEPVAQRTRVIWFELSCAALRTHEFELGCTYRLILKSRPLHTDSHVDPSDSGRGLRSARIWRPDVVGEELQ